MTSIRRIGEGASHYVFLHGSPSDSSVWEPLAKLAPSDATCWLVDLPDHGRAHDASDDALELENDVAGQVRQLADRVTLVGHSLGAYLAPRLAHQLGERVARMVLLSGFARLPSEMGTAFEQLATGLETHAISIRDLIAVASGRWYGENASTDERAVVAKIMMQTGPARARRSVSRLAQLSRDALAVRAYTQPTVVLHGKADQAVPFELGVELARLGEHAELRALDTHHHMLPMTHAAELAPIVFEQRR